MCHVPYHTIPYVGASVYHPFSSPRCLRARTWPTPPRATPVSTPYDPLYCLPVLHPDDRLASAPSSPRSPTSERGRASARTKARCCHESNSSIFATAAGVSTSTLPHFIRPTLPAGPAAAVVVSTLTKAVVLPVRLLQGGRKQISGTA